MTVYFLRADYPNNDLLPKEGKTTLEQDLGYNHVGVYSRWHNHANEPKCIYWRAVWENYLSSKLKDIDRNIAIQGELCGYDIAGNREGFSKGQRQFYIFRIFDIDKRRFLPPWETEQIADDYALQHVPVHGYFELSQIAKC